VRATRTPLALVCIVAIAAMALVPVVIALAVPLIATGAVLPAPTTPLQAGREPALRPALLALGSSQHLPRASLLP
jgi:hypothetical protein